MTAVFLLACAAKSPPPSQPRSPSFWEGAPDGASTTETGMAYEVLRPGYGTTHPSSRSTVTVHYSGTSGDGVQFDSSHWRGEPTTFALDQVIRGWTEGLQLMVEGELTRFWIPADLAYGYSGPGPVGQLVFDIELIGFVEP